MRPLTAITILLAAITIASAAHAQDGAQAYDPNQLPSYRGQVQFFTLTPPGDIDGLILTDGTEIKTPPHLSTALAITIRPGDAITVHGLKAAQLPLVQALSVTNDATGRSVIDFGPDHAGPPSPVSQTAERQAVSGRIRMLLHGPLGDINGVLLEDGTVLRVPPPEVSRFNALFAPGQAIAARGIERVNVAGKVVEVTAIGASPEHLQSIP
jgi:hypothetical protein